MHIIKAENLHSWLLTDDKTIKYRFWKALRFPNPDRFHIPAFVQKRWDGFENFFNVNSGMFLSGLMPEIMLGLRHSKIPYKVVDNRNKIDWLVKTVDKNFLAPFTPKDVLERDGKPVELHDYQVDYINQAILFNRGIITAPTGAGKTYILISILKCLPPKTKVLFLTKNKGLVHQNYLEMKQWGIQNLGRWYGDYKEINDVMCVVIHPKPFENIQHLFPQFDVVIVDEVHECMADVATAAYRRLTNAGARFGISATPYKYAGKDKIQMFNLKGYFGGKFKTNTTESGSLTTKDLQARGILSPSRCTIYPITEPENITHEPYGDAVTLGIANNFYFHETVKRLARSLKGRTLILVERKDQGEYLKQLMPDAHWIWGNIKLETREEVYRELKVGESVICIAMRHIITAGINVYIHNMINAAGGNAEHNIVQQIGRGLRCAKDKDTLDFYDFLFKTNDYLEDHSMNRIATLDSEGHKITIKEEIDF
jgi:superfamily II DNA or RNA helicase